MKRQVPANFRVEARTEASVTIGWDPPFSDGGCPVIGYVPTVDLEDAGQIFGYSYTWPAPDQELHSFEVRTGLRELLSQRLTARFKGHEALYHNTADY